MPLTAQVTKPALAALHLTAAGQYGFGMSNVQSLPGSAITKWKLSRGVAPQPKTINPTAEPNLQGEPASNPDRKSSSKRRYVSPSNARAPRAQHRRDVADWAPAYLAALEASARKAASAKMAGVTLRSVQRRRVADPRFAEEERDAMRVAVDMIEDEVTRRAFEGVEEPVFGSGGKGCGTVQIGVIRRYSDALLLRLAERSETGSWRQKQQVEHTPPGVFNTRAERLAALEEARREMAETGHPDYSSPSANRSAAPRPS